MLNQDFGRKLLTSKSRNLFWLLKILRIAYPLHIQPVCEVSFCSILYLQQYGQKGLMHSESMRNHVQSQQLKDSSVMLSRQPRLRVKMDNGELWGKSNAPRWNLQSEKRSQLMHSQPGTITIFEKFLSSQLSQVSCCLCSSQFPCNVGMELS